MSLDNTSPNSSLRTRYRAGALAMFLMWTVNALATATQPHHAENVLHLKQEVKELGESQVYITDDALKIVLPKHTLILIAKAPDWQVVTFNTQSHLQSVLALKDWLIAIAQVATEPSPITSSNTTAKTRCEVASLPCVQWLVTYPGKNVYRIALERKQKFLDHQTIVFYSKTVNRKITRIVAALYSMPPTEDFPFEYKYAYRGKVQQKREKHVLKTISAQLEPANPHLFDVPKNYKTTSLTQIMMIRNVPEGDIKEMIEDIGIGKSKY